MTCDHTLDWKKILQLFLHKPAKLQFICMSAENHMCGCFSSRRDEMPSSSWGRASIPIGQMVTLTFEHRIESVHPWVQLDTRKLDIRSRHSWRQMDGLETYCFWSRLSLASKHKCVFLSWKSTQHYEDVKLWLKPPAAPAEQLSLHWCRHRTPAHRVSL